MNSSKLDPLGAPVPSTSWPSYTDVLAPYVAKIPGLPSDLKDPLLRQEVYQWLFA